MTNAIRVALSAAILVLASSPGPFNVGAQQENARTSRSAGQSVTVLSDGMLLLLGGDANPASVAIFDPLTRSRREVGSLTSPRTGHTATVMPDGTVLIAGGVGPDGQFVGIVEQFNPATEAVATIPDAAVGLRAHHTATLLTDGRVLFVGGKTPAEGGARAELWNPLSNSSTAVQRASGINRTEAVARLLADGRVRISGGADAGSVADEIFDPAQDVFVADDGRPSSSVEDRVAAVRPADGAIDVPLTARVSVRFSNALQPRSAVALLEDLQETAAVLVPVRVVSAESGTLLFVTPSMPLAPGHRYRLTVAGARTVDGRPLRRFTSLFTASELREPEARDTGTGRDRANAGGIQSPWRKLPPRQAPPGVTALAGQVLLLNGAPLADVTLEIEERQVQTDRTGRFLLPLGAEPSGWHEMVIDGTTANRGRRTYGVFEVAVQIVGKKTAALPYTIWMPEIDTANAVRIPSPTAKETVIASPHIPGLELHLPPHTVITDRHGKVAREVSITPIPVDQPPFPLPTGVQVPVYFTIQPGAGYVSVKGYGSTKTGAWLAYPNYRNQPPGTEHEFWHYDPEDKGWHVYGMGRVSPNARQVIPNPGVFIYEFTGAMINNGQSPGPDGGNGPKEADPVDLSTGQFVMDKVDLVVQDVVPLVLARTYRTGDSGSRPFGVGATHQYAMFLWSAQQYAEADLILPDGKRIHYVRTSSGTGWVDAVFEHTSSPTAFYKSTIVWNGNGWDLRLKDGTVYVFGELAPLQAIRDRFGNTVRLTWSSVNAQGSGTGNIVKVTSPNGRWISFTYDGANRVTQARDSINRTVGYEYDGSGRLWKVTDARGGVTEYTYDIAHRMLTITDPRNIVYLDTTYDVDGRVEKQTQADGGEYEFGYTVNGSGQITQTDVTNPRGYVRRVAFNADRFMTSDTRALGETIEQTATYSLLSGSNLIDTVTDELGRVTKYQYDSKGNVTSATSLHGTSDAVTISHTYDATYNLLTSTTDPLNHTTSIGYDALGRIQSTTDALSHQTTFQSDVAGRVTAVTSPLSKTTSFTYDLGDLAATQTPLGNVVAQYHDAAGRPVRITDASGAFTGVEYNTDDQVTRVVDPLNGDTTFTYDGNGNMLTLTDPRGKTTTWTYDNMDRVATRTDPLARTESFEYDLNGNLIERTDRKGQVTVYEYDALDRPTFIGFGATGSPPTFASTITTTYDAGDRATDTVDSVAGTIERTYDLLDRLIEEVTPQGTIAYTYDAASRRASMTVAGQTAVSYTFDAGNRLTGITQGTASVGLAYDNDGRRTSLTLPNGIVVEYGYDDDSRLTGLIYKQGLSTLGTLAYTYDANGRRTTVSGTWARTNLPAALTSATYDDANQVVTFGGTTPTYDDNGNLTSDGVRTYSWNARDQLASLAGPVNGSFAYDAAGRRRAKTIGGTTTEFVYDGLNPVQELSSGSPTANLLTGLSIDEYFTRIDAAGVRNYLPDALGSSVALADSLGGIQTEYTYEPFGAATATGASTTNPYLFTGRENDGTGIYYYRARYYHPSGQRFVSEDPLQCTGSPWNLFEYAASDPISRSDPLGLQALPIPRPVPLPGPLGPLGPLSGEPREVLNPESGDHLLPSRSIPMPKKPRSGCTCVCRADADDSMPGNLKYGWPTFAFGSATASSCEKASKEAKRQATHNLGMKPKHIPCRCAGK